MNVPHVQTDHAEMPVIALQVKQVGAQHSSQETSGQAGSGPVDSDVDSASSLRQLFGVPPPFPSVSGGQPAAGSAEYLCPLYRTQLRYGAVGAVPLQTRSHAANWTLAAVAMLLDPYRP